MDHIYNNIRLQGIFTDPKYKGWGENSYKPCVVSAFVQMEE